LINNYLAILQARKIQFNAIDVSTDDSGITHLLIPSARELCKKAAAGLEQAGLPLPMMFSFGEYRGGIDDLEERNEDGMQEVRNWFKLE
jgi:hypothetical protein